jgi:acyl-CoA reductase-like NAD-dependent aldehyde dehydrogenase
MTARGRVFPHCCSLSVPYAPGSTVVVKHSSESALVQKAVASDAREAIVPGGKGVNS